VRFIVDIWRQRLSSPVLLRFLDSWDSFYALFLLALEGGVVLRHRDILTNQQKTTKRFFADKANPEVEIIDHDTSIII
jgi:hypothetical protein